MLMLEKLYLLFKYCFSQFHQTKFLVYCSLIFISSLSSYAILIYLKTKGRKVLPLGVARMLFVNAEKSDSNALQIGGIPFAFLNMIAISGLFGWFPYLINDAHAIILQYAAISWVGILIYGYLDDRYEIRPIVKLVSQFFLISLFCLRVSNVIYPQNSALAFIVLLFFSVAIVNGANLMDGLDTLSYKLSSVIYFAFIILASPMMNLTALFIACACFFSMSGFYFYNREPSKVHLGEVGVSCLGFSYIVLAVLTFDSYKNFNSPLSAMSKAIFPCVLPLIELGVSFLRRILNGKSPFRGDKLHVHHILHEVKGYSASTSSSIMAMGYLIFLGVSFMVMEPYSSYLALFVLSILTVVGYLIVGRKLWFNGEINITIFQQLLVKKEVRIISSNTLSDFRIIINPRDPKQNLERAE